MNKQYLLDELDKMNKRNQDMGESFGKGYLWAIALVKTFVRKMEEPKKVTIPKFVADWIEEYYSKQTDIFTTVNTLLHEGYCSVDVCKWAKDNQEVFLNALLNGYTVEQEKLYTVEIPDPHSVYTYTVLAKKDKSSSIVAIVRFDSDPEYAWKKVKDYQLTESEIKRNHDWAWQWAVPVEE